MNAWAVLDRIFGWGGVLAYHGVSESPHSPVMHVSPRRLREQLEYLHARYEVLTLAELLRRWRGGRTTRGCVAVTFDDAHVGVVEHAGPILRELGVPATIFVSSEFSRLGAEFWWDVAERDRLQQGGRPWTAMPALLGLEPLSSSDAGAMATVRERVLGGNGGRWVEPLGAAPAASAWRAARFDELRDLARNPMIDFGVHTVTHPALPMLSRDEQVRELREGHRALEAMGLPRVQPVVAYPYGLYDRTTIEAAREAGMTAGFSIEGRAPAARPDLYTIPRVGAGEVHPPSSLERRLSRALRPALVLRNRGPHPRLPERTPLPFATAAAPRHGARA